MMDKIVAGFSGKGPQAFTQPTGGDQKTPDEIKQEQTEIRTRLMKDQSLTKVELAQRMRTSRAALDRLLDPKNPSVTLLTLQRAAKAVGGRLNIKFEVGEGVS